MLPANCCLFCLGLNVLTHWGRVTHICVGNLTIIGPDHGLSPGRRQANIKTNAGILLIEPLLTNFSEISTEIHTFSFKEMRLKVLSAKMVAMLSRPQCVKQLIPDMYATDRLRGHQPLAVFVFGRSIFYAAIIPYGTRRMVSISAFYRQRSMKHPDAVCYSGNHLFHQVLLPPATLTVELGPICLLLWK